MAQVRLRRFEVNEDLLPPVCLRCGAEAEVTRSKNFAWHPPWVAVLILVGLLPYAIVAIILTKRMKVEAPLCPQHQGHWQWRALYLYLGLALFVVLGVGSMVVLASTDNRRGAPEAWAGFLCLGSLVAGLAWLISAAIIQHLSIRPTEITDKDITLTNVSPFFVEALHEERDRRHEEDRSPRRRDRDRDDEAVQPRRRHRDSSYDNVDEGFRDENAFRSPPQYRRTAEDEDQRQDP